MKEELEEIVRIPNILNEHLQDEELAPRIMSAFRGLQTEKRMTDGYYILYMGYNRSPIRDFESYLRIVIGLDEDDIQLILKQYNEKFITYELSPGIYTIKDFSEAVHTIGDHKGTLKIEYDDISMKTKPILTDLEILRFDKRSFFHTLFKFETHWDYKPDPIGVYTSGNGLNLNKINKIQLKTDVIDGSVVNGIREPILFSFVLNKPSGYNVFCEPETIHYKKINKSPLNTITFYLEDNNNEEVNFTGETLTFTMQKIKI